MTVRPRLALAGALAAAVLAPAVSPVAAATAASGPRGCPVLFPASFERQLARDFPGQRVTASVYDTRTGCWFHLHRGMRITTASVIKAQVMGAVLLLAQDERRHLTRWERARIRPMIRYSLNNPYVSDLYAHVGWVAGMDRFDRRVGATHTTNTPAYGATVTTADDRTRIARALLYGDGPLRARARRLAWRYMSHVHPTQRWGITAGMRRGWRAALKNGFYPMSGHGWRVGSTGFLRSPGRGGYAITVMTDQDRSQFAGIRLVERVARHVAAALSSGPLARRPVDRARCVRTSSHESWTEVARRLHASGHAAAVRLVSGGNPQPLAGQRACRPRLSAPPSPPAGRGAAP